MSMIVTVEAKGLLSASGVSLKAHMSGTMDDALQELKSMTPDNDWVAELLRPVLMITIPSCGIKHQVTVDDGFVKFECSKTYLKLLVGYCESRDFEYYIKPGAPNETA